MLHEGTVMRTSNMILARVKDILRTEGSISLVKKVVVFPLSLIKRYLFYYGTFYLYEKTMDCLNEADFMPRIHVTFTLVSNNQQASELAANDFEDIRRRFLNARRRLDSGAIAFCLFHGRELAYIGWVAMTEKGKSALGSLPFQVLFSDNQAYIGDTFTVSKYRGKGLMTYVYIKRLEYLRKQGITSFRYAVNTNNTIPQRIGFRSESTYARAHLIKILWWLYWKEVPVEHTDVKNPLNLPPVATE